MGMNPKITPGLPENDNKFLILKQEFSHIQLLSVILSMIKEGNLVRFS